MQTLLNYSIDTVDASSKAIASTLPHSFGFYLILVIVFGFIGFKAESKIVTPLILIVLFAIYWVGGYATAPM